MHSPLSCLEIGAARDDADLSVILMHGLGADGHDFEDVAMALVAGAEPRRWRFVLPHAPEQKVTINMGMEMPAWYDILDMSRPRIVDWDTVRKSHEAIAALMAQETAPIIILAGFSQGAAMALHVGLRNQEAIAGILMMSGYLLTSEEHPCPAKTSGFPIGIFHGSHDEVVPLAAATETVVTLKAADHTPTLKTYEGVGHSLCDQEIQDVFRWLVASQ